MPAQRMGDSPATVLVSFRTTPAYAERLRAIAKKNLKPRATFIREAVETAIEECGEATTARRAPSAFPV